MIGLRYQDPSAELDYAIDWTAWLTGSEVIVTSTWTVSPTGEMTIPLNSHSTVDTTAWVTGGVLGATYTLTNDITTNSSPARTDQRSFQITIQDK